MWKDLSMCGGMMNVNNCFRVSEKMVYGGVIENAKSGKYTILLVHGVWKYTRYDSIQDTTVLYVSQTWFFMSFESWFNMTCKLNTSYKIRIQWGFRIWKNQCKILTQKKLWAFFYRYLSKWRILAHFFPFGAEKGSNVNFWQIRLI